MSAVIRSITTKQETASAGFQLTEGQLEALRLIEAARLHNDVRSFTLSGYPGSGKTTIISEYAHRLSRRGLRVAVTAPTNKATRILMKKIGRGENITFSSTQSLLGLRADEKEDGDTDFIRKQDSKVSEYDVVIVDECSMVSPGLHQELLDNQKDAFLIFVGDPYQLPPVDKTAKDPGGHLVARISPSFRKVERTHHYVLSQIVRQAAGNPIIDLATAIRECEKNQLRFTPARVRDFLSTIADERLFLIRREDVAPYCESLIRESQAKGEEGLPARIVAWRNATVQSYNQEIHEAIFGASSVPGIAFAPGEYILAHQEFEAAIYRTIAVYDPEQRRPVPRKTVVDRRRIMVSEEGQITSIELGSHPSFPDVASWVIDFIPEPGHNELEGPFTAFVPVDQAAFSQYQQALWNKYREKSAELKRARDAFYRKSRELEKQGLNKPQIAGSLRGDESILNRLQAQAKDASRHAWSCRKAHAEIRHAYASTAHKSQGSTWPVTIIDLSDLDRMPDDREYNRALYVAVTRSSGSLAIAI